ncbi:hypothetical protein RHSIM_Rhsim01G0024100 [Rhododendron simsii]|uniref:SIAH-type domain-containing protein n=1 Tax=Rhododendron simsii TaxID=118357 RepID=A0A834HKY5_RHOSS|nr:hypothetical protein RHSIM_Rhsim01G0024100 [Rhododendron simsii]
MEYLQHLLMRSLWVVLVVMLAVENGCNGCLEKERISLLQLKDSINFPNGTSLPSWEEDDNMDCCHWERIECNFTTHRVIKLDLNRARDRRIDGYWHLNASILLPFESLRSLNLYENRLRSFVGNEGIGILPNWSNLEELDLSYNYFDNSILLSLNKLSNLKSLRLAWNALNGSIYVEEFNGLNNLRELDLTGNAHFSISALHGIGILSNFTNLEELDLSWNNLGNDILPSLNKLSNLKFLCLAWNNLNGSIYVKEFDGLNNLKELDLSRNVIASISALNEISEREKREKELGGYGRGEENIQVDLEKGNVICADMGVVVEPVRGPCQNTEHGCPEESVTHTGKNDHEETCIYAPCSCPLQNCAFIGSSEQLNLHFSRKHQDSGWRIQYNCPLPVSLNEHEQFLVLQAEEDGLLFLLNKRVETFGHTLD